MRKLMKKLMEKRMEKLKTEFVYSGQEKDEIPKDVQHLIVADGQAMIPNYAFWDLPSLETVTMSSSVKEIGGWAFFWCTKQANVHIQKGLIS